MLASLPPNSPTTDQTVKDLLGHRARASHTRYSSVSFSQRSDSPSIYSRGDFSPGPLHTPPVDWPVHSDCPTPSQDQFVFDDADEENPLTNGEQSLLVAGEDDGESPISAPTPRPAFHRPAPLTHGIDPAFGNEETDEAEEDPRMSMLGPKMRFVSRAPWEMGGDDLAEEDEEDPGSAIDTLSIFSGKTGGRRSRDNDKSSVKGLALPTFRSRSPATLATTKKSGFGINFGLYFPKTPESQSEGPYGPYISGASQSHNDIPNTFASSSRSSDSATDSQSSDNLHQAPRSEHTSPAPLGSPLPPLPFPHPPTFRTQNASCSYHNETSFRSDSPSPSARYVHPYAHPDLLSSAGPPPLTPLPRTPSKSLDQSSEEHERLISPPRRTSESPLSSPRPLTLRKASAGGISCPVPHSRMASDEDEDAKSLHPFARPRARASTNPVPSSPVRSLMTYADQPGSPMRSLITLEQARARAQNVSHTPTQSQNGSSATTPAVSSTLVAGLGLAPGVVVENSIMRGPQRSRLISDSTSGPPLHAQHQIPQSRPRTLSTGKHRYAGAGLDGDGVSAAKALKHKKSAFMKLFQGGKDKERDKEQLKESLPPVPQTPVRAMSTPPQTHPSDPSVHHIKRVPPPLPLSVVVTSPSVTSPLMLSPDTPSDLTQESSSVRAASPPRHRQASSPLPSSNYPSKVSSSEETRPTPGEHQGAQASDSRPPASAPPTQSTFTTLSLRPVSTIFSAQFPDLLSPSSPPNIPTSILTSRPNYPSPTTPIFSYSRSNSISTASDYPVTPTSTTPLPGPPAMRILSGEDQSGVVMALQEQIINSRKTWQRQIWELEGQIKDLKSEVEELRTTNECGTCGKAKREGRIRTPISQNCSIVDRPRPRMGGNTRSVFGGGNDM